MTIKLGGVNMVTTLGKEKFFTVIPQFKDGNGKYTNMGHMKISIGSDDFGKIRLIVFDGTHEFQYFIEEAEFFDGVDFLNGIN